MNEVSWFQQEPTTSLALIQKNTQSKDDAIIDVGGGDGFLVDNLLELGYTNITVLDISANAINKAKERLGINADKVKWIVSDITDFIPAEQYDVWHDRAAFHFLTEHSEIQNYTQSAAKGLKENGTLIIGTFSETGPLKCSGIEIKQYSETSLTTCFLANFNKTKSVNYNHPTPFNTTQNFVFCSFKRKK